MIVEPKVREFICTTAHPTGCEENVRRQIEYVKGQGVLEGPKKVLVIGASTGYGLASRIMAGFGCRAATLGVMFERQASGKRTATPGWYNTCAFEKFAKEEGLYVRSINGDAFTEEIKQEAVQAIREDLGQVDMVIYSLAAPRRKMPDGTVYQSILKTTGESFTNKSLDLRKNVIVEKTVESASDEELEATIKVMGGEDWKDWISCLKNEKVLADQAVTVAYSYIGPELTYPIYADGTIGQAKKHLHKTAEEINRGFPGVNAFVSVNKALVTQASSAIPIVPLYFSILYKVMKEHGVHEGCIQQIARLFHEKLLVTPPHVDKQGLIRMDDWELEKNIQSEVMRLWSQVTTENLKNLTDLEGYWEDFYHMFGFHFDNVDYNADVEI